MACSRTVAGVDPHFSASELICGGCHCAESVQRGPDHGVGRGGSRAYFVGGNAQAVGADHADDVAGDQGRSQGRVGEVAGDAGGVGRDSLRRGSLGCVDEAGLRSVFGVNLPGEGVGADIRDLRSAVPDLGRVVVRPVPVLENLGAVYLHVVGVRYVVNLEVCLVNIPVSVLGLDHEEADVADRVLADDDRFDVRPGCVSRVRSGSSCGGLEGDLPSGDQGMVGVQLICGVGVGAHEPFVCDAGIVDASDAHQVSRDLGGVLRSRRSVLDDHLAARLDVDRVRSRLHDVQGDHRVDVGYEAGDRVRVVALEIDRVRGVCGVNVRGFVDRGDVRSQIASSERRSPLPVRKVPDDVGSLDVDVGGQNVRRARPVWVVRGRCLIFRVNLGQALGCRNECGNWRRVVVIVEGDLPSCYNAHKFLLFGNFQVVCGPGVYRVRRHFDGPVSGLMVGIPHRVFAGGEK